jgi:hypothetical protein
MWSARSARARLCLRPRVWPRPQGALARSWTQGRGESAAQAGDRGVYRLGKCRRARAATLTVFVAWAELAPLLTQRTTE